MVKYKGCGMRSTLSVLVTSTDVSLLASLCGAAIYKPTTLHPEMSCSPTSSDNGASKTRRPATGIWSICLRFPFWTISRIIGFSHNQLSSCRKASWLLIDFHELCLLKTAGKRHNMSVCQVTGCGVAVVESQARRLKTCEPHRRAVTVDMDGVPSRFCQQCTLIHPLNHFDGAKRGCRRRLELRNSRYGHSWSQLTYRLCACPPTQPRLEASTG